MALVGFPVLDLPRPAVRREEQRQPIRPAAEVHDVGQAYVRGGQDDSRLLPGFADDAAATWSWQRCSKEQTDSEVQLQAASSAAAVPNAEQGSKQQQPVVE